MTMMASEGFMQGMLGFIAGGLIAALITACSYAWKAPCVEAHGSAAIKRVEIGRGFAIESFDYELTPSNAAVKVTFVKETK